MTKREQKRRPKPKDGTVLICGVCGDRALGYNFDAISCESCKAFFRRNALKVKPFTCSFDGNCKLDAHTRKFCSGCRLKKCLDIGMKKDWILDADQLMRRRQRQQRRYHQHGSVTDIQPCSSTSGDPLYQDSTSYSPDSLDNPCQSSVDHMSVTVSRMSSPSDPSSSSSSDIYPNTCHTQDHMIPPHPSYHQPTSLQFPINVQMSPPQSTTTSHFQYSTSEYYPPMEEEQPAPSKIPKLHFCGEHKVSPPHVQERQYKEYSSSLHHNGFTEVSPIEIKQEMDEVEEIDKPVPLTPYLKDCLENLTKVYDGIFEAAYKPEQLPQMTENPQTRDQLFNMTEIFIRRLIRFARHLPEFKSLTQHDQIHLLKGGIMEMFVLRSPMSFDSRSAAWKFKTSEKQSDHNSGNGERNLSPSVLKLLGSTMYKNHMTFVITIQELAGRDRVVLILLFIIDLLSPDRPQLQDTKTISLGQERHFLWLRTYLESIHPPSKVRTLYPQLLEKLLEVRKLGEASCQMVMDLDISKLEPLLLEVFDMSS